MPDKRSPRSDAPPRNTPASPPSARGPTAEFRQARLAFLGLTNDDAQRLRELTPRFEEFQKEFVDSFYGHLFAFESTARFLTDADQVARLKQMQRRHFESLLEARWDAAYFEGRQRVGDVHAEVGVDPEYFLGAYNQYVQYCLRYFADEGATFAGPVHAWISSLVKVVFLDIGLTLDSYFTQSTSNLRNALDMLWRANQELRQFAQLTTHDLKTPLATVANLCDEALDEFGEQMPDEAKRLIESARRGVFRMGALIDELLAQVIVSPVTDDLEPVNTRELLAEVIDRVRPLLTDKSIQLVLPRRWPTVWGNKVRLREACFNLLSNAAKFVDSGGRIELAVRRVDGSMRISFIDNGPGIPTEELERIFVPFRRLPMHRGQPGSGLGLYFTKNLIEDQGGRVWAESEPGHGSLFHIELPLPPADKPRPAAND